ncbi:MAG: LysM peptidoglycan-binding domain-containing protein, partial [Planctomycetota bacterium]
MCELCHAAEASGASFPGPSRRAVILAGLAAAVTACARRQPQQAYRYVVGESDDLTSIARRSGLSVGQIIAANDLSSRHLQAGQVLWLPGVTRLQPLDESAPAPAASGMPVMIARSTWG